MSEKRFVKDHSYLVNYDKYCILDKEQHKHLYLDEVCKKLNEQQATIITLKRRLEKINGGYGHLTHRNGLTANKWLIESQERELKKKNEQISDWIEQHSKDIVKISKQQATISQLEEEKEYWKNKAMTLLLQVRRLTSRMSDKEVIEFRRELEDE